jgi:hypothetical protein
VPLSFPTPELVHKIVEILIGHPESGKTAAREKSEVRQ